MKQASIPSALATAISRASWRTSSRSQMANCVEVATLDDADRHVALRDSKDRGGPVLVFGSDVWSAFVTGTRRGAFDQA